VSVPDSRRWLSNSWLSVLQDRVLQVTVFSPMTDGRCLESVPSVPSGTGTETGAEIGTRTVG